VPNAQRQSAREHLAVALDVASVDQATRHIERIAGVPGWLKIGFELFTAAGPASITLAAKSSSVFLDLKFHDIPTTVARAVASATRHGAALCTLHASGGLAMLRAAKTAAAEEAERCQLSRPKLVAVTVLTSLAQEDLPSIGIAGPLSEQVARLVDLSLEAGLDGVVASAREAEAVRRRAGTDFLIVTPGIRPAGSERGDQYRVATPSSAIRAGADLLVVGRPILQAENPADAARAVCAEIETALEGR